ncbi:MAG TPA: transporter [Acetobacteraceae bacterium]|nr:transporter [Acetobacteraceae bacterium]
MIGVLAALVALPTATRAGSARDYLNVPVDSWLATYNFGAFSAVTPEDGTDVTSSLRSNVIMQSIAATRSFDFFGRTAGLTAVLPYVFANASSGDFRASTNGLSDAGFLAQVNIFGGPALSKMQFASFVPQTFSSFHLYVGTPTGSYSPTTPLNPSANRWTIVPTINYSYTPDTGWTWLETYISTRVFGTNGDYRVGGSSRLSQKPLFVLEGHASRNLLPRLWVSLDAYYDVGGETSIDGVRQRNAANTLRLGAGLGLRVWRGCDVVVNYEGVVARPAGEPAAQAIRMTIRQFW